MNVVEAAASTLQSRFLASMQDDADFRVEVAKLRLLDLQDERRELEQEISELRKAGHRVLANFLMFVRRDVALLSFVEALHVTGVSSLSEVARKRAQIVSTADKLASFDVMAALRDVPAGEPRRHPAVGLDVIRLRQVISESIASKLKATPLSAFVRVAQLLASPELQHEVKQAYEKLQSAVRRVDDKWDARLRDAGHLYLDGKLEVAEAARLLSLDPADVAFEFERLGYVRSMSRIVLSDARREELLRQIEHHRKAPVSESLIDRDVIASQRIEGIDARAHRLTTRVDDRDS